MEGFEGKKNFQLKCLMMSFKTANIKGFKEK